MTLLPTPDGGDRLAGLLAVSPQLEEWSAGIGALISEGRRLVVAHTRDRTAEAMSLGVRFSAATSQLESDRLCRIGLRPRDLVIGVTTAAAGRRPLQPVTGLACLPGLLHRGVVVWGITGPRPNPISPYCHDILAVPTSDLALLLRCHRLAIGRLTGIPHRNEGSRPSGT